MNMEMRPTNSFWMQEVKDIISGKSYVNARIQDLCYTEEVVYMSGPVGQKHSSTGRLSAIKRWERNSYINTRIREVDPSLYLKLYVPEKDEHLILSLSPTDVVKLGEFESPEAKFSFTAEEISVKIENLGRFGRADLDDRDLASYFSWAKFPRKPSESDYLYQCGSKIDTKLREAWKTNRKVVDLVYPS